jgi:hypothetical protein
MTAVFKAQLDPVVDQPFGLHPLANTHLRQQIHRSLLEHSRTHALFDILPAAILYDDGIDSL